MVFAPCEVVVPRLLFQVGAEGVWAAAGDAEEGPEVVEVVSGVAALAFAVGGGGHFCEEVSGFAVTEKIEQDGSCGALAVVLVRGEWQVIAVRNGALMEPPPQELRGLSDGAIKFGVADTGFAGEHHTDGEAEARLIHCAVSTEVSVIDGEPMSPRADAALAVCGFQREAFEAGEDGGVTGCEDVLADEHHEVAVVPGEVAVGREIGGPSGFFCHEGEVFFFSAGEKGQSIEGPRDCIEAFGVIWGAHSFGEGGASLLENAFGFFAVERRVGAVASEDRERDGGIDHLACAPVPHFQFSVVGFGGSYRVGELNAGVTGEKAGIYADNDIFFLEDSFRGGGGGDVCDENLACGSGVSVGRVVPASCAGGTEGPVVFRFEGQGVRRCEVNRTSGTGFICCVGEGENAEQEKDNGAFHGE